MSCISIKIIRKSEQLDIGTTLESPRFAIDTAMASPRLVITATHICAVGSAEWFQLDVTPLDMIYRLRE